MAEGFVCQTCGIEAPTNVEFYYNIGMLVARQTRQIKCYQCKRCIHKDFWKFTLLDLTLGWWGMISLVMTPIFFVNNLSRYLGAMSLPAPPPGAAPPVVMDREIGKLSPFIQELTNRLNQKEPLQTVAPDIARRAGTTPGQVVAYLRILSQAQRQPMQPPVRAVPVAVKPPPPASAAPSQIPLAAAPEMTQPASEPPQPASPPPEPEIGIQ